MKYARRYSRKPGSFRRKQRRSRVPRSKPLRRSRKPPSITRRLQRLERVSTDKWIKEYNNNSVGSGAVASLTFQYLGAPAQWSDCFSGSTSSLAMENGYVASVDVSCVLQMPTTMGLISDPDIDWTAMLVTQYIVCPKTAAFRMEGMGAPDKIVVTDLTDGVQYCQGLQAGSFPLLNWEYFTIMSKKTRSFTRPHLYLNLGNPIASGPGTMYCKMKHKIKLGWHFKASNGSNWEAYTQTMLPLEQQLYALTFLHGPANTADQVMDGSIQLCCRYHGSSGI